MSLKTIKLCFDKPVHFGNKRLGESGFTISSDTLFSALFIEAIHLNLDTDFLLEDLLISDTFPFKDNTLFLPKPMIHIKSDKEDLTDKKLFKKLKFIPVDMFKQYLYGDCNGDDVRDFIDWLDIGTTSTITKVALESLEAKQIGNSQPYNVGIHSYSDNSGIYFLAKGNQETFSKLSILLESLQHAGLGGKRKSGYGKFSFEMYEDEDIEDLFKEKGEFNILLSTAMVNKNEDLESVLKEAQYLLKKRSGFVQSQNYSNQLVKKKDFYSFTAGSVFSTPFKGGVFDVSNQGNHPVYRYAKAFWLEV